MRPIRALFCVFLLALTWLIARIPAMTEEIERLRAVRVEGPKPPILFAQRSGQLGSMAELAPLPISTAYTPLGGAVAQHAAPTPPVITATPLVALGNQALPASIANDGHAAATKAYALLAAGDRRAAAAAFRTAIAQSGDAALVEAWRTQLALMTKRWSGSAYIFIRDAGPVSLPVRPELGGGQVGGQLAYTPDPLSRRPFALVARIAAATEGRGLDPDSAQAAIGLGWRPFPGLPIALAAERLIALGPVARDAWTLRLAGGIDWGRPPGASRWLDMGAYAEAAVIGTHQRDVQASAIARAGYGIALANDLSLVPGAAIQASIQHTDRTIHRIDVGPSARLRWATKPALIELTLDWRFRATGDAQPDSGPALTLSTQF